MADTLDTTLTLQLKAVLKETLDYSRVMSSPLEIWDDTLSDGTGLDQADTLFPPDKRTLAATSETLDLTALTYTIFSNTITVNFARVKMLALWNLNTTNSLTIGGAAANPWTAIWSGTWTARPNGRYLFWAPDATGYVTAGGSKNLKIDAGANTIDYRIMVIGGSV